MLIAACVLLVQTALQAHGAEEARLTILHTNDLHGRLIPFHYAERSAGSQSPEIRGGAARRATLIRRLRRSASEPTILVDAGDIFTRGALTNAYEGAADVAAMNATGYELAAIGNNEFKARDAADAGDSAGSQAALLRVVRNSRFPWLCANLTDALGRPLPGIRPYVIRRVAGLRVGFLSVTAPRSAKYQQTRGWSITDPLEAARVWVPRVRARCDVVIAVTHIGDELDQQLATSVPGIDAIVGGDSHTFLYEPTWVEGPSGRRVPIVQAGEYGVHVGEFKLRFAREAGVWRLQGADYRLVPVTADLPADRAVVRALEPYVRPFLRQLGTLDTVGTDATAKARRTTEILVEALRAETGADLAMNPSGVGLVDVFHSREVRRYDLYAAMPFRNRAVIALLSGAEVERLRAAHPDSVVAGAALLNPDRLFRVAMMDYVAAGAYGIEGVRFLEEGLDVRDLVERHLRSRYRRSDASPARWAQCTLAYRWPDCRPAALRDMPPSRRADRAGGGAACPSPGLLAANWSSASRTAIPVRRRA